MLLLQDMGEEDSRVVLGSLCSAYWYPVYAFIRRSGTDPHEAEDLTQGFFAHILERRTMAGVSQEQGRFRSYLLGALKHFMQNEARRQGAWKRGGRVVHVPLEADEGELRFTKELSHELSPDKLYDRAWADALLARAMLALERDYYQAGKTMQFEQLRDCLTGRIEHTSYEAIGEKLGMSVSAITNAVYRLRLRYRDLIRREIAATVDSDGAVDEELRSIFQALGG